MSWDSGGNWLYLEAHTVSSNPSITDPITYNYSELSGYYDCDTFPYQVWSGSAGGGGGRSGSSSIYDEIDYEPLAEFLDTEGTEPTEPSGEPEPFDAEEEKSKVQRFIDWLRGHSPDALSIQGTDDQTSTESDGPGIVTRAKAWFSGLDWEAIKTNSTYIGIAALSLFLLWLFWGTVKSGLGLLFRFGFGAIKILFSVLIPIFAFIWGFAMTGIGLIIIAVIVAAIYIFLKLHAI